MNIKELKTKIRRLVVVLILVLFCILFICSYLKSVDKYASLREFVKENNWIVYYNGKKVDIDNFDFDKEYSSIMINDEQKKMELEQTYHPGDSIYVGIKLNFTVEELAEEK